MEEILAFLFVTSAGFLAFLAFSPIGRAIADRLRHRGIEPGVDPAELEWLRDELAAMRHQVAELAERQDFTERLLGQARERGLLSPPRDG